MKPKRFVLALVACLLACAAFGQGIRDRYEKREYRIPMRDGVQLYTAVYLPRGQTGKHPILLERTPYGAGPYGADTYPGGFRGSAKLVEKGYIFAFQDVRGQGQSQGRFLNVRPQILTARRPGDVDESSDAYDTIDFLVKNVPDNNGRVGIWGISYPGFYAAASAIHSHPALKAVSPQAPVSDWFVGDDFHHNGALMLMDAIGFGHFGETRGGPDTDPGLSLGDDAYRTMLAAGSLAQITQAYFAHSDGLWKSLVEHPDYDDFWQARSLPDKLDGARCAILTVGGWYDAEDCWGALHTYAAAERQNPKIVNALVMGPWYHGMWASRDGSKLGQLDFGSNTAAYFQEKIELPFFEKYLREVDAPATPEAQVFETGTNRWRAFSAWPPREARERNLYPGGQHGLDFEAPTASGSDTYVSDPASPVPYEGGKITGRTATYPVADQRFADGRPDVLTYRSAPLESPLTIAGPIDALVVFRTTGTDLDLVVKVIDVYPDDAPGGLGGFQRLIRAEVFRTKYRDSYATPAPLVPDARMRVTVPLPDVLHTFGKGHRLMVQVQSSWFPLVDRNPQTFVDVFRAKPEQFRPATVRIEWGPDGTRLRVRTLNP